MSISSRLCYSIIHFYIFIYPAPSGPKISNSEKCCGSENARPPKIFWDMEGHRGQNTYFGKNS